MCAGRMSWSRWRVAVRTPLPAPPRFPGARSSETEVFGTCGTHTSQSRIFRRGCRPMYGRGAARCRSSNNKGKPSLSNSSNSHLRMLQCSRRHGRSLGRRIPFRHTQLRIRVRRDGDRGAQTGLPDTPPPLPSPGLRAATITRALPPISVAVSDYRTVSGFRTLRSRPA